jgi:DNA-directed RNA polymerase subunit RPC12/RpoP
MTANAKRYRIPCRCGVEVVVVSGQAGGQIACERCGGRIAVPRLRDLEASALAEVAGPLRQWRPAQGWLFAGVVVAVLATLAAVLVSGLPRSRERLPDETMIRGAIESADAATVYLAWRAMRGSGIDRGVLPEESRLQQAAVAAGRIAAVCWTIAAAGGLAAVLAAASCLIGARPSAAGPVARSGPR